jgi:hypothetical protein
MHLYISLLHTYLRKVQLDLSVNRVTKHVNAYSKLVNIDQNKKVKNNLGLRWFCF